MAKGLVSAKPMRTREWSCKHAARAVGGCFGKYPAFNGLDIWNDWMKHPSSKQIRGYLCRILSNFTIFTINQDLSSC